MHQHSRRKSNINWNDKESKMSSDGDKELSTSVFKEQTHEKAMDNLEGYTIVTPNKR